MTAGSHMKPYPEYKDSGVEWLGEVPDHWKVCPGYKCWNEGRESNAGMKNDNVLSLSYGRIIRRDVDLNMGLLPASFETYQVIHPGDIVLRLTDLQNDKRSLRVGQVKEDGIITSAYVCLRTKGCDSQYIYCLLHSYDTTKVFYNIGGGVRQGMKYDDVKRLPILLPPLPEQEKIAAFLDYETGRMDRLIEKQERLIELLKEKRQAVISHAVTKGLDPDVPMKDSGVEWLGEVPAHWEVLPLKYMAAVKTGFAFKSDEFIDEGIPVIRIGDVGTDGLVHVESAKCLPSDCLYAYPHAVIKENDILMAMTGATIGKAAKYTFAEPALLNQRVCLFRAKPSHRQVFLWSVLNCHYYKEHLAVTAFGGAQPNISDTELLECSVPMPPKAEQDAIAAYILTKTSEFDALMARAADGVRLLQERRTALISAAVTGKIDVRDWKPPREEAA